MRAEITLVDDDGTVHRHTAERSTVLRAGHDGWMDTAAFVTFSAFSALQTATGITRHLERRKRQAAHLQDQLARLFEPEDGWRDAGFTDSGCQSFTEPSDVDAPSDGWSSAGFESPACRSFAAA